MKKISLLLFAMILSLAAMAQLNPYAYGLSSDWDAKNQTLTVDFKLNAKAKKIEIFAVDRSNSNKRYKIHEITSPGNTLDYSIPIHINGKDKDGTCLPVGKNLTFAVKVDGDTRNTPGTPVYTGNRPFSPHGVAVNNCQDSQDFGAVYVTECTNGVSGNATWGWLSDKGKSLLKYDPRLKYEVSYRKNPDFSVRANKYLEPHRVRVSEDGRIFVSSYNRVEKNNSMQNQVAVWEYKNGTFTPLIYHNSANTGGLSANRLCGMDVKGSGGNLKLLLCFLDETDTGGQWANSLYVIEYSGTNLQTKTHKLRYRPDGSTSNHTNGLNPWSEQGALEVVRLNSFNCYYDGFVNIAYAGQNKDDIIMAIDYFYGYDYNARMFYFRNPTLQSVGDKTIPNYAQAVNQRDHYYGGAGLLRYVYSGDEYALSGRAQFGQYNGDGTNTENSGRIQAYKVSGTSIANSATSAYSKSDLKTLKIINDIALDCANNVYAVSFTDGANSTTGGSGNLLAYAMPYSGTVTTYCPTSNADEKEYFILPERTELPENLTSTALDRIANNNSGGCGCNISLNRPMQADMFSTICLPFDLNISSLPDDHPYKNADILAFDDVVLSADDNGNILELSFVPINGQMVKNTPYLIRPKGSDISDKVLFDNVTIDSYQGFSNPAYLVTRNNVTFWGMIPSTSITLDPENDVVLILVADNRLAKTTGGSFLGLRGFFYFDRRNVPANVGARIAERKPTPTSVINLNGEQVDVQKFLRESRVYIRMGETLYTITGEIVE